MKYKVARRIKKVRRKKKKFEMLLDIHIGLIGKL